MASLWSCAAGHQLMVINQSSYLHARLQGCVKLGTWFETVRPSYFQIESPALWFPYSSGCSYFAP